MQVQQVRPPVCDAVVGLPPQVSAGSRDALAARTSTGYEVPEAVDADRQICAKYYVNQILSLDEDSLRRSWNKVRSIERRTPRFGASFPACAPNKHFEYNQLDPGVAPRFASASPWQA